MMQLLSVLFKCKLHFLLFRLILVFSEWQLLDTYLWALTYFFFLILKIYQNHMIVEIIFFFNSLDHSLSF